ncbi:hypothetical protein Fmac_030123 [Flemingia macrophylla]|uniref:HMA domain-containing protein n=1 Tax=Flemingia macrophylla TaxID=520843 RepID=A0ABD1LCA0_9FABA
MKQKITVELEMHCDKCRNKALKIAAEVPGVTSVSLEGDNKNRVAATGEDVDMVCLVNQLKKKFRSVIIVTVEDMIKAAEEKKKKEEADKKKKEEEEEERREREKKLKKLLHAALCKKCHSSSCHGKCNIICTKCLSTSCDGECFIVSVQCDERPKCIGHCKPCSNCHSSNCDGCKPCSNCHSSNCGGCKPTPPPCPKWCTCPKCYVPNYPACYYPYPNQVVYYDSCPDSLCSIM